VKRTPDAHEAIGRHIRGCLGDKWTVPVVSALSDGSMRFGELWRQVGTSPKVLTEVLRALERDGLVERHETRDAGLHVEYRLSSTGRAFHALVGDIDAWASRHERRIVAARGRYTPPASRSIPADAPPAAARTDALSISHICLPVRDIDRAMREFSAVLGIDPSSVCEVATVLEAGRRRERIRICWLAFPNLLVELIQQIRGTGPFNDFLENAGLGVAHIGVDVAPEWRLAPDRKSSVGLKVAQRPDGPIHRADVDLSRELGTDVHLLAPMLRDTAERWLPKSCETKGLGGRPVSRIGIVVPDVMRADRICSKLLRVIDPLRARRRAFRYRQTGEALVATCGNRGIAIDLIQPTSRGPLHDYLVQHGPGVHHLGFGADTPDSVRVRLNFCHVIGLNIEGPSALTAGLTMC
jgi:DNA-binding HxlR family transcriptional regulator